MSKSNALADVSTFPQLVRYLRDEMGWPIATEDFEELTFDYTPEELGLDSHTAAKIQLVKRLRPLSSSQPWTVFFVKFEPKKLPVVVLRRILSRVVVKKRASLNPGDREVWEADDLLFVSSFGTDELRQISFAHFSQNPAKHDLPTLKVLGWDNRDTPLHLDHAATLLTTRLAWPKSERDTDAWRREWEAAFQLRPREVVTTSKVLAERLAELARAIRDRIATLLAIESARGPITGLMRALQQALVHDLDSAGFADMYAQTIAYGLLSARIASPEANSADDLATHMRTNPFLRELMETFLKVGGRRGRAGEQGIDFDELGVNEVVELLDDANMDAVIRDFGDRNPLEDPVIHFYELFLGQYDKQQKVTRGVFYTPRPVVSYIVRSVDELLRTDFGLSDGLADTSTWGEVSERAGVATPDGVTADQSFVQILDPATGTGTFLVEVIDVVHATMVQKWRTEGHSPQEVAALWDDYVPEHLLPRLHGFELLMAPYAIAHLKVGLKLFETGYRFGSEERARIYLTNSLESPEEFSDRFDFAIPALAHEAQAVNSVKANQRFTVVLGNPPYSGISSNMSEGAQRLVDAYKSVDGKPLQEKKLWLQDDYVKFIRLGQMALEKSGVGVLGFITNHSYLDNPTFRGMRRSLMGTFQGLTVIDLHGNATRSEQAPDGSEDANVFDIKQGVAVSLAARGWMQPVIRHAELWGARSAKYAWLAVNTGVADRGSRLQPDAPYYFFRPQNIEGRDEYEAGWSIAEAMRLHCAGFITARDHFVIDFDRVALLERVGRFGDLRNTDSEIRNLYFVGRGSSRYPDGDTRGWQLPAARQKVADDSEWESRIRRCSYRPFDQRFVYWSAWMIDWPRPELASHMRQGENMALHICRQSVSSEWGHVLVARGLIDDCYVSNKTRERGYAFPLYLHQSKDELRLDIHAEPNFSASFLRDLGRAIDAGAPRTGEAPPAMSPEAIIGYVYAVFHSPSYRQRYAEFLKVDFPRVPLPGSRELFEELSCRGEILLGLHLLEHPAVDSPTVDYFGARDVRVSRVGWLDDVVWIDLSAARATSSSAPGTAGFANVEQAVWDFHIGGYQVCEKWLKDRKGRTLSDEDIAHYQKVIVAISETIRLMSEIDEVIEEHGGWPAAFSGGDEGN